MRLPLRIAAVLVIVLATYYFIYWVPFSFLLVDVSNATAVSVSLLCAAGIGWWAWNRLEVSQPSLIANILSGALIGGAVGFGAGFFGPMIFSPGANQGPLLGIFITGPIGFFFGAIGGFAYGTSKKSRTDRNNA